MRPLPTARPARRKALPLAYAAACRARLAALVLVLGAAFAMPAAAGITQVADLFAAGSWEQARAQAAGDDSGARPAEALLWRSRLAKDPATAIELLQEGLRQKRLGKPVRARLALEIADLELGRGHPAEALTALSPLLDDGGDDLPGHVQLVASRALVALGRGPRARELLAAVRTADPAYAQSRALLGDIAMLQGDGAGALRWYDAADQADTELRRRTVAGRCRALLRSGRILDVQAAEAQLAALDDGSLALVEIRRALREHSEQAASLQSPSVSGAASRPRSEASASERAPEPEVTAPEREAPEPPAPTPEDARPAEEGRYTLQLGAFTDRGRALEFRQRLVGSVPGLAIEEGRDPRGQSVYRARTGAWSDPASAGEAAVELGRKLGLDVIVVDRQAPARPGG
jgi:cell division septation protein DedD